jgi:hypothetical protein
MTATVGRDAVACRDRSQARRSELAVLGALVLLFFVLQVWNLPLAAFPRADEGVHAEAGRMIVDGYMPYRDFSYAHPPLLPVLIGVGLKITHAMLPLRVAGLLLNCLGVIPLYLVVRKLGGTPLPGLIAVTCYLTYHEMVHHDFRFLASRQLANLLFVLFLYFAVVKREGRGTGVAQGLLAGASLFVLYQAGVNVALVAVAAAVQPGVGVRRGVLIRRYAVMGLLIAAALAVFFLAVPGSFDETIRVHFHVVRSIDRAGRLWRFISFRDSACYLFGVAGLLAGAALLPRLRALAVALLATIMLVLVPREFYPHYWVLAAPAFTVGIWMLAELARSRLSGRLPALGTAAAGLILATQATLALPSLLKEWLFTTNPEYHATVRVLANLPEPLLVFYEPIYGIDAGQRLVHHYYQAASRGLVVLGEKMSRDELARLADQACTILVTRADLPLLPREVVAEWQVSFRRHDAPADVLVLTTDRPGCGAVE